MPIRKTATALLNAHAKRAIRRRARTTKGRREPSHRTVALIVASALFMEQLDGTVLATALPKMAESFGTAPLNMNVALTSYLLSLAVFIPVSGKVADRFGSRTVFCSAIALFTLGSVLCGLATSLPFLVASRIAQGIGGAMMVPIGRLVLLRSVSKGELVSAMTWLMVPAQIGPILGPPLGGFLVSSLSWRWIFYINVPIGLLGIVLALRFIGNVRETRRTGFDFAGLLLSGVALSCLMFGLETVARGEASFWSATGILLIGLISGVLYVRHAHRHPEPVLDFRLMAVPTFGLSVLGGGLSRISAGAIPFLLPMMLQLGFGWSAASSGLVTFASSAGSMLMRLGAKPVLRRWGFRRVMIWNGVIASLFLAGTAALRPSWPLAAIYGLLLIGGFFQSLQFIAYNTIAYADIPQPRMSAATSFYATFQQLNLTLGICVASGALATSADFRRFLAMVEKSVPADLDVHVVMDNASSHKTKLIRNWFAKRPLWHVHFTPTSASWINQVERFFDLLTDNQIRRGAHRSVRELEAAITAYIDGRNADPKPFRWVKSADDILASIQRFCQRTKAVQDQCA